MTVTRVFSATTIFTGIAIFAAAPGHADQNDYISMLDKSGVNYASTSHVIDLGNAACRSLRMGNTVDQTLGQVQGAGYPAVDSGIIVSAATYTMCRDQNQQVLAWARAHVADGVPV